MTTFKKSISVLLALLMIMGMFSVVPFSASAEEVNVVESGAQSGTTANCTWSLDNEGVLTISGNGEMGEYDYDHPWNYFSDSIVELKIEIFYKQ